MAPATKKTPKEGKAKTATSSAPKKPRAHPPYAEMINEAITALKERTGSSQFAIAKFIEEKQKANLPNNFKKLLLVQLKKLVANGKLVKVKNSFKIPPKSSAPTTAKAVKSSSTGGVFKKPKSSPTTAATKKPKSSSTGAAAKKPKSSSASAATKKAKSSSTSAAAKKPNAKAKEAAVKAARKVVVAAKAKKLKSIKSPVKKVVAKKGKK